jgi:hypothetical protein
MKVLTPTHVAKVLLKQPEAHLKRRAKLHA